MTFKRVLIVLFACMGLTYCKGGGNDGGKNDGVNNDTVKKGDIPPDPAFERILEGMSYNYVLHISENYNHKTELLAFYKKSDSAFVRDSTLYHQSVREFFNSGPAILNYLAAHYTGDKTRCPWIYSVDPFSSRIDPLALIFTKEKGAVVLIHDYILQSGSDEPKISATSEKVQGITGRIGLSEVRDWLDKNANLAPVERQRKFREHFKLPAAGQ